MADLVTGLTGLFPTAEFHNQSQAGTSASSSTDPGTLLVGSTAGVAARVTSVDSAQDQGVVIRWRPRTTKFEHRTLIMLRGSGTWQDTAPGLAPNCYVIYPRHGDTLTGLVRTVNGVNTGLATGVPVTNGTTADTTTWRCHRIEVVTLADGVHVRVNAWNGLVTDEPLDANGKPAWDIDVVDPAPLTGSGHFQLSVQTSDTVSGGMEVDAASFRYYSIENVAVQNLATFSFAAGTLAPSSTATGVTVSNIEGSAGASPVVSNHTTYTNASAPQMETDPQGVPDLATALAKPCHWRVRLTAGSGPMTVTRLRFKVAQGGDLDPRGWELRSDHDNYAASLGGAEVVATASGAMDVIDLDLSALPEVPKGSTRELRVYHWTPAAGRTLRWDDILVDGTIAGASGGESPGPVTGLTADPQIVDGDHQVYLAWTPPPDTDFDGVMIRRAQSTTAPSATSGTLVANTNLLDMNGYRDSGLLPDTTYSYSVFARDTTGLYSQATSVTTRTLAVPQTPTTPPPSVVVSPNPANLDAGVPLVLTVTASTQAVSYGDSYTGSYQEPAPETYTYSTTQISGPDTLTLANATTATPSVTGVTAGDYVIRVAVTGSGGTTTVDVPVTVTAVVQPSLSGVWTRGRGVISLPAGVASVRIVVQVEGCVQGETHRLDAHGLFHGEVTDWSRGGLTGQVHALVERSDNGTEWEPLPGATAVTLDSEANAEVVDYEAPPGVPRRYRATVMTSSPLVLSSTPSEPALIIPDPDVAWLKDPTDPSLSHPFACWTEPEWVRERAQRVVYPDGRRFPVVQTSVRRARQGEVTLSPGTVEDEEALERLLDSGRVLLFQTPARGFGYPGASLYVVVTGSDTTSLLNYGPRQDVAFTLTEVAPPAAAL